MKYSESQLFRRSGRVTIILLVLALFFVFGLILATAPAHAQSGAPLSVSTGTESGSYHRFMLEAKQACPNSPLDLQTSSGAVMNLERLEANDTSLGFVQTDVLALYSNTRDMSNIKVLLPVFQEQVHIFTRGNLGKKEGGYGIGNFKVGGSEVVLSTAGDIVNRKVASAGGSFITAQVFRLQSEIPFQLTELKDADAVIAGVISGQFDAGILVGAQPLGSFTKLGENLNQLKLLAITPDLAAKISKVYTASAPLTYRQMGANGTSIATVGVGAALVTQNYKAPTMSARVIALRDCIQSVAEEVAATPKKHPAWRDVAKGTATSKWPLYEVSTQLKGKK